MRDIDPEFLEHLQTGATSVCRCWKVIRKDGVELGFTDFDGDLTFDGVTFLASTGMDATALEASTGLSVDNGQAIGALSAVGLTDADILAGRYDSAEVVHYLVNWKDPEQRIVLFRGSLGEIKQVGGQFEVELRGLAEVLNQPIGRAFLKTCDRVLGDTKCGFDLNTPDFFWEGPVSEVVGDSSFVIAADANPTGFYEKGVLTWGAGANVGTKSIVKYERVLSGERLVELWQEAPLAISVGDQLRLDAGCDKRAGTCKTKFDNFLNFRGFPHIPGEDALTNYPGKGEVHNGKSLFR